MTVDYANQNVSYNYKKTSKIKKKFDQLLRKILEKGHEHLTIMFIPHSEKKIVNFQVSRFSLGFVALVFIVVAIGGSYYWVDRSNLENKLEVTSEQAMGLLESTQRFARYTAQFKDQVKLVIKASAGLIRETGKETVFKPHLSGKGGPIVFSEKILHTNKKKKATIKEIEELDVLVKSLKNIEKDIKSVKTLLKGHKKVLKFMPSIFPVYNGGYVVSNFGFRRDPFTYKIRQHNGLDIANIPGTPIVAAANGIVKFAQAGGGRGLFVEVQHKFGFSTIYMHMSVLHVEPGQVVKKGQIIGRMGSTGRSTGPHLHYEVRINGLPIDPAPFITLDKFSKIANIN